MKTLIAGGGDLSPAFLAGFAARRDSDFLIAADSGLDVMLEAGLWPDLVVGDYDSLADRAALDELKGRGIPVETYPCEKDFSDAESALRAAVRIGSSEIDFLGGCGGRLDHFLANVLDLRIPLEAGIPARLIDEKNEIFLADRPFTLRKEETAGRYVSLLPLDGPVEGVVLRGFRYAADGAILTSAHASLGISNEIAAETAEVTFTAGTLIVVLSDD